MMKTNKGRRWKMEKVVGGGMYESNLLLGVALHYSFSPNAQDAKSIVAAKATKRPQAWTLAIKQSFRVTGMVAARIFFPDAVRKKEVVMAAGEPESQKKTMWRLGEIRTNYKGGKFLRLEPLFWSSPEPLPIPWEPSAFGEGQRPIW